MARPRKTDKDIRCPLEYALDVFGGRWKSRILCVLCDGPLRYSAIRSEMVNVTDAALAVALKDLTAQDMVERISYDEIPPRVEYALTPKGRSLIPVLQSICTWAGQFYQEENTLGLTRCQHCDYRG